MNNLTLEQVARMTGVTVDSLRKQQMVVQHLRANQQVTQAAPPPAVNTRPPLQFKPSSGPMKLQKQLYDAGVD